MNGHGDAITAAEDEPPVLDWHQEIAAMKPVDEQFPDGKYPVGQCETYYIPGNSSQPFVRRVLVPSSKSSSPKSTVRFRKR